MIHDFEVGMVVKTIGGVMNRKDLHAEVIGITSEGVLVRFPDCYGFKNYSAMQYSPAHLELSDVKLEDLGVMNLPPQKDNKPVCCVCGCEDTSIETYNIYFVNDFFWSLNVCKCCAELADTFEIKTISLSCR
jgi:hypothetical protein